MEKIRLGIIGIGNMGSGHAGRIKAGNCPDFVLTAVADINPARLEWAKKELGEDVLRFNSAEEMLDSGKIDACIVAVPHYDHPKYVIECLKRGIHVMCEKPAGVYTKQVREMNEEAEKHPEVVFGMMFNQRTNCVYKKMRELVQSGKYGQIRRTNWIITDWYRPQAYFDSGSWRATWAGEGGGVLLNQAPHNLDLWQWICGMPVKISAHMKFGKWHDIEVEDDVTAYCEYENGATGVFITTTGDAKGTNRFEIQLDKAKIVADYLNSTCRSRSFQGRILSRSGMWARTISILILTAQTPSTTEFYGLGAELYFGVSRLLRTEARAFTVSRFQTLSTSRHGSAKRSISENLTRTSSMRN